MRGTTRPILYLLFALSGFSGLIYESIWAHYLKLFLGHAAYAQTLVLAIFMGGMAAGSWFCGRYSQRWKNLLAGYAVVEAIIGLFALLFHTAFTQSIEFSYNTIIPKLGTTFTINFFKWSIASVMILPQSVLLGMTFPLMSSALLRLFPDSPGKSIAMLYFTNSIGAVIGVLASGFMLIRMVGLPWTVAAAGIINITLALAVLFLVRTLPANSDPVKGPSRANTPRPGWGRSRLLLLASVVTGMASFIYEIGWIRMLSLVLGTSTHAFELMLSAFILGLALGGLWIQHYIDRIATPVTYLAKVQVSMGLLALSTLFIYGNTFEAMQWLVGTLEKGNAGYTQFNLASSAIAMAIMLPATFCAGMTLPLITLILIKEGAGERSVGAVYAANTLGGIAGVFFAIHIGMPLLGLKGLITMGALLDMALGMVLIWSVTGEYRSKRTFIIMAFAIVGGTAATLMMNIDLMKMGSGVYRAGEILTRDQYQHIYHLDGKTATVDVFRHEQGKLLVNTNGKTDASIMTAADSAEDFDEPTMVLLAAIPMALNPDARSAAVIGLGCGLTSHTLLGSRSLRQVDTVEIEQGMVGAAHHFRPYVERVFTDPRSRIHIEDAKTFFASKGSRYDIIVSEPSNPWVSGVSGLFSDEFYRQIRSSMSEEGLFVQWVQLYEINTELVISILKAISANFSDYGIYASNDGDIMIIARKSGQLPVLGAALFANPELAAALKRIKVEGVPDLNLRWAGNKKTFERLIASYPVRANSDYYPILDQNAARARFLAANAIELQYVTDRYLPVGRMLSGSSPPDNTTDITQTASFMKTRYAHSAMALRDFFQTGTFSGRYDTVSGEEKMKGIRLKKLFYDCGSMPDQKERLPTLFAVASLITPYLTSAELSAIWQRLESGPCAPSLSQLDRQLVELFKSAGRQDPRAMIASADVLLEKASSFGPSGIKFITATGMLGHLLQGKRNEAYRLWTSHRRLMFDHQEPDLLFRLLVAESK